MKWNKTISISLILMGFFAPWFLLMSPSFSSLTVQNFPFSAEIGAVDAKIVLSTNGHTSVDRVVISGNADWNTLATTEDWCSGSGTSNAPYIIDNIEVDANTTDYCMFIYNTNVHFIVRNCIFKNGYADQPQVVLSSVSNGQLLTNIFSNSAQYGVAIEGNNNLISGNTIADNKWGIGIHGLYNTITNNRINNSQHLGLTVNDNHTTITDNNINNNGDAGILIYGDQNYIAGNSFNNPDGVGIAIDLFSLNNTITGNWFRQNLAGIQTTIGAAGNKIYKNCFEENQVSATDISLNNTWDNGGKGNYWDDYTGSDSNNDGIGDTPYEIGGSGNNVDNFPLMECPLIVTIPFVPSYDLVIIISLISLSSIISIYRIRNSRKNKNNLK
jgi:parallel beta-helix repeat protein